MTSRLVFAIGFVASAGALGFAFLLQHGFGLYPCSLCWLQRAAMLAVAVVCLAGLMHAPSGQARWVYTVLGLITAGIGVGLAGRHVWLQSLPADADLACMPGMGYMMDVMPLTEVIRKVLSGDASCANIEAAFLGISLPAWTLVGFVALCIWLLVASVLAGRTRAMY